MAYDVAVIASTVTGRRKLLDRSIRTWCDDAERSGLRVAIRVYGDGCGACDSVVAAMEECHDVETFSTLKPSGSHVAGYNFWQHRVPANVYLFTHPEILFPAGTIGRASLTKPGEFTAFKCFWLPEDMTADLDCYDWRHAASLEAAPELFPRDPREHGEFYWNSDIRSIARWESTTTHALHTEDAARIFPMPDFGEWGPDDPWHLAMRRQLGIRNQTVMDPVLFHQWHEHGEIDEAHVARIAQAAL